ncbi:NmrA family NAD(P)-binding protein [Dactylosporangium aurantiacum]|uniref:NmrA family NAD(P)-binding protein n=1 Tax=Dactylosporangium aurantiacum TaxID=35754 RepID=A0A9Q9MNS7_9ACTN|nr:NmrA family NAD(P)-binding protein [Dactylosporangium aurantiacum]
MKGPVLVIGASGNVGGAAARSLLDAGLPVRVAGTDPGALRRRFPTAEAVRLDFLDPATFDGAAAGAGALFLLRPPPISRVGPTLNAFVDAAARHGVGHVVFASVAGADTNRLVPHHRVEQHLRTGTVPWTILRPGFFAQNLGDAYRTDIATDDRIVLPAGDGRAAFIDTRDIGEAAAVILADPHRHAGNGYLLTGPQALSFTDVARLLTGALDRPIRYEPTTAVRYLWHLRRRRTPLTQALVQTVLHTGLRHGQAEQVDPTLPRLLGRPARTLEQYIGQHRHLWSASPPAP